MENSIKTDETADQGIRRIYTGMLDETKKIVRPPRGDIHDTIHNTRKSFKFCRALHRLVKSSLGTERFEKENFAFRDLGRMVSDLRDHHVMIVMLHHIVSQAHSVRKADVSEGFDLLNEREEQAIEKAIHEEKRLGKIEFELISAGDRLESWPEIIGLQALLPGLGEVYAKGRAGFQEAEESSEKGHFHEWRKQVKYLLHQFEVLFNYWPDTLGINGTSLQQLSDYLGEEHDLAIFEDLLNVESFATRLKKKKAIRSYVNQKRSFLQRSALNLGEFIYAKTESEFLACFTESEMA